MNAFVKQRIIMWSDSPKSTQFVQPAEGMFAVNQD